MATILEIETRADVAATAADLNGLGDDARRLGADLDAAGDDARRMGADLSGLGDGSDELASKSSQATGALGALAGGLEAVGLEKYAAGLEGAAIATDVMSGAGDALNLIAETAAGRWIVTTARTVAHTVAVGAQTAATVAMTAAQGALNAVMALNPIALVVIAVVALVAALVLAYKNSETFRNIVDGAFTRARDVVAGAVDAVRDFLDWLGDLPGAAREAWESVRATIADKIAAAIDLFERIKSKAGDIASSVKDKFSDMFAPIQDAIGWVQDLIDKIKSIDFPDFPDVNPFGRAATGAGAAGSTGSTLNVTLLAAPSPLDPEQTLKDLLDALREYALRRGYTLELTEVAA